MAPKKGWNNKGKTEYNNNSGWGQQKGRGQNTTCTKCGWWQWSGPNCYFCQLCAGPLKGKTPPRDSTELNPSSEASVAGAEEKTAQGYKYLKTSDVEGLLLGDTFTLKGLESASKEDLATAKSHFPLLLAKIERIQALKFPTTAAAASEGTKDLDKRIEKARGKLLRSKESAAEALQAKEAAEGVLERAVKNLTEADTRVAEDEAAVDALYSLHLQKGTAAKTTQEATARETVVQVAAAIDPSDDKASAAFLESKVALVRGKIEAFEAQITKAKKEAADLKATKEKKDKKAKDGKDKDKDKDTPGAASSGRARSRSPETKRDEERMAMLACDIGGWETKLPLLKAQHDQLATAAAAINTTSAALNVGLADLDL